MSEFAVTVETIAVEDHPNADRLQVGRAVGMDYQFIVGKGQFQDGDLFVYIPEQAVLPPRLLAIMGLEGKLAGSEKNRVKAIKLRGLLSQGLALSPADVARYYGWDGEIGVQKVLHSWLSKESPTPQVALHLDLAGELDIHKYEPPIPQSLQGKVRTAPSGPHAPGGDFFRSYTEIENIKKVPDIFNQGEPVVVTEKLHGSCCIVGWIDGEPVVSSKGIAKRGLMLEEGESNTYWRVAHQTGLFDALIGVMGRMGCTSRVLLFGEVFGVQDLMYGLEPGQLGYRAFDLYVQDQGPNSPGRFLDWAPFEHLCKACRIPVVPVMYEGPWDRSLIERFVSGPSYLSDHIREGIVVKPRVERRTPRGERVIAKWVSPEYLVRKSGTEFE